MVIIYIDMMMNGELSSIVIVGKYTHESYGYNKVLDCSIP